MSSLDILDRPFLSLPLSFFLFKNYYYYYYYFTEMTTKFNKDIYAKVKGKKNEPLSNIGQRRLKIVDKEKEKEKENESIERGSSTPTLDEGRVASLAISIEEVDPPSKKRKMGDKGKEKVGFNIWADAGAAMTRENELLTLEEMREISIVPPMILVSQHVHKLVQVIFLILFLFFIRLLILVMMRLFVVKCWEKRCTSLLNIWQMRRRSLWPTQKWRRWRPRLWGYGET